MTNSTVFTGLETNPNVKPAPLTHSSTQWVAILPTRISSSAYLRAGLGLALSPILLKQNSWGRGRKTNKTQSVPPQSWTVPSIKTIDLVFPKICLDRLGLQWTIRSPDSEHSQNDLSEAKEGKVLLHQTMGRQKKEKGISPIRGRARGGFDAFVSQGQSHSPFSADFEG